ncbi:hypothetical protein M9H77_22067 [Catharanthus roseus]|uniref:Uncharacterized protein n=1 Tax=Catharanthus roseus TaxID=4058 RepID=A0ACC0ARG0_CATRO|nr:hypothetical protein M9H77_22067 [Catharanthus roseus]
MTNSQDVSESPKEAQPLLRRSLRVRKKNPNPQIQPLLKMFEVPLVQTIATDPRIQQAKNLAVAQAQQEGCTGNYRVFDSAFGNFLVPVVPTRAELRERRDAAIYKLGYYNKLIQIIRKGKKGRVTSVPNVEKDVFLETCFAAKFFSAEPELRAVWWGFGRLRQESQLHHSTG